MILDSVLNQIAKNVQQRLEERKSLFSEKVLRSKCEKARVPHLFPGSFKDVLSRPEINLIAEIKRSSPSQGRFSQSTGLSPTQIAGNYLKNGATAFSVLTEQDHFDGKLEYLSAIRSAYPEARLLMKDFVIEDYQLLEARIFGADAALLIIALLGEDRSKELLKTCRQLGLTALVEVHDEEEMRIASRIGADLIGVNNRNLNTLEVSLETSERLAPLAPHGAVLISESGISTGREIRHLRGHGFSGFLVGSSFMKTGNPGQALFHLISEAREAPCLQS